MNKLLLAILLLFSSGTFAQTYMSLPIVEVYDGDTIKTSLSWRLPAPLNKVSIRIYGIDTPEMPAKSYAVTGKLNRAKCIKEAEFALQAKAHVVGLVGSNTRMKITDYNWGRNRGRIVANVSIGGVDIAKSLLAHGFAVPYYGSGIKQDWCK